MKTFLIYSFCKINISLRVIKKLHTGLHKIQSIVTFVNLFDIIKIKEIWFGFKKRLLFSWWNFK